MKLYETIEHILDPNNGENNTKTSIEWLQVLAACIAITTMVVSSFGLLSLFSIAGIAVSGLLVSKMLIDNRKNIYNGIVSFFNYIKSFKNVEVSKTLKRIFSIDRVLENAILKEPFDTVTLEKCLTGKYWNLRKPRGYRKIDLNEEFVFEDKKMTLLHFVGAAAGAGNPNIDSICNSQREQVVLGLVTGVATETSRLVRI